MRKRRLEQNATKRCKAALLTCETDLSLLELLCEDGFLEPAELPTEESSVVQAALLKRAVQRGFLMETCGSEQAADLLMVKRLDALRVWTDLIDEDVHLRAPPLCA